MTRRSRSAPLGAGERDARGAIAAALWVESLGFGVLFGTIGAFVLVMGLSRTLDPGFAVLAALGSIVVGGGFGFVVGQVVGLALALIAAVTPRRSRIAIVRVAIPLVALTVSVTPVLVAVGRYTTGALLFTAFDVVLTLVAVALITRRYLRLEARSQRPIEAHRVH